MSTPEAIEVVHAVPRDDLGCGVIVVAGTHMAPASEGLTKAIAAAVAHAASEVVHPDLEARRQAARDVLRNGRYKPTGRGKPASEYLLRAAGEGDFPRVNGVVDALNLTSLEERVPISVWDLDKSAAGRFEVRLGKSEESYVFNRSGQSLALADLVCGAAVDEAGSRPIVTPIKDCQATKIDDGTERHATLIYFPLKAGGEAALKRVTGMLTARYRTENPDARIEHGWLLPGRTLTLGG